MTETNQRFSAAVCAVANPPETQGCRVVSYTNRRSYDWNYNRPHRLKYQVRPELKGED